MWFEVIADRFDWFPKGRGVMVCFMSGRPHFGTRACVEAGLRLGKIRKIRKPTGWKVGKDGRARRDG